MRTLKNSRKAIVNVKSSTGKRKYTVMSITPVNSSKSSSVIPSIETISTNHSHIQGIVVGAMVFRQHDNETQTLLLRRIAEDTFPLKWETPGGGVEIGVDRSLEDAAVRELREETGLEAKRVVCPIQLAEGEAERVGAKQDGIISIFTDGEGSEWAIVSFIIDVEDSDVVVIDPEEHDDWLWAIEEEVRQRCMLRDRRPLDFVSDLMRSTILEGFAIVRA